MAKKNQRLAVNTPEQSINIHEDSDDSILNVDELIRLQECSPELASWLMSRVEYEQTKRHENNDARMILTSKNSQRAYTRDVLAMFYAFFIVISGMGISGYFIYLNKPILGSIFAGGTLLYGANSFLNFARLARPQANQSKK